MSAKSFWQQVGDDFMNSWSWPAIIAKGGKWLFDKGSKFLGDTVGKVANDINGTTAANQQYNQNLELQHDQQAFNSAEAEKQRQFELNMANTSFQRGAADLRAAGLNPWLMVQNSGAATPAASAATSSAGSVNQRPSGAQTLASLASTAVSAALIAKIVTKLIK